MKTHTPQIILGALTLLIAGCSKHSEPATNQKVADYGVVDVSSSGTSSHDIDLGDGNLCVIKSFVITDQTGSQMLVSSAEIKARGGVTPLITFSAQTNPPDQATFFTNGRYFIKFNPHIKP
jgi:hypothetical protein